VRQLLQPPARLVGRRAHRRRARTFGFVVFALLLGMAVFATTAAADQPATSHETLSGTAELTDICSFPVTVDFTANVTETEFVDTSGNLTRVDLHLVEQDTFSANGKTLVGLPYTANVELLFDSSGNITHIYGEGVVERILLPNGSLFVTAGRTDFINHPEGFVPVPDVGAPGDVAGFCAALSP
jgi:hypothetical protein